MWPVSCHCDKKNKALVTKAFVSMGNLSFFHTFKEKSLRKTSSEVSTPRSRAFRSSKHGSCFLLCQLTPVAVKLHGDKILFYLPAKKCIPAFICYCKPTFFLRKMTQIKSYLLTVSYHIHEWSVRNFSHVFFLVLEETDGNKEAGSI